MALLDPFFNLFRSQASSSPTREQGVGGTAVFGGYIEDGEKNPDLSPGRKYETYTNLLANVSIVAASVRYFLNLVAKAEFKVEPADDSPRAAEIAEWFEHELANVTTSMHRIIRRAGLYRYYGYGIQEWTARRNEDGTLGIKDVEARPQHTIEQWALDETGTVVGMVQRSPQDGSQHALTREKVIYIVDDSVSDSPEGLGLFRHIVDAVKRLQEYEKLEGIGFETDLRGIPIGRAPVAKLRQQVKNGELSQDQANQMLDGMRNFLKKHKKTANLALMVDSAPYESRGDAPSPGSTAHWGIELLKAGATSAPELALAIQRINREIARVLGTENILLGESGSGSLAMSKDKSEQFALVVDSTTKEIAEAFEKDLIQRFMDLNGWPDELRPKLKPSKIQMRSVEEITGALRDLAAAFGPGAPDDEAINDVRDMLGVARADLEQAALDAALTADLERQALQDKADAAGQKPGEEGEEGEIPKDEAEGEEEPEEEIESEEDEDKDKK